ncbi:DNA polymerase III subunit beta [endosymbiont of Acanthamoeba sp. UWC8]|uniref:DNA polymerase III subunit beta n=1 Tax=endosymbiont of Acanthamoeba sp. UWC8 TaxID=86106 RepID=UPI0004D16769|nr:DNA polymerase III subunit beta [endosymbiont of Acanthamoeba sp. UWC8]AIF80599.1 DNA polymerase III subunit beta [endosymbiont of Acanthamoeba sp. UWC8]
MKIVIKKSNLQKALNHVQSIVEKRNAIAMLANVKIEAKDNRLAFTTTDMDISITDLVEAEVDQPYSTTIPVLTLYEIVKKIPEDADITFEASADNINQILVKFASSKFTLPCLPAEEFPNFELGDTTHNFKISSSALKLLLTKTRHAISNEETRYYLNGIYLHSIESEGAGLLRAVSTDGHRLARAEVALPEGAKNIPGIIIPKKTVNELIKLVEDFNDDINIGLSVNKAIFEIGNSKLITKLIDGKFPDYTRVIPTNNDKQLEISCKDLIKSIELVISVSSDKTRAVKLDIEPSKVVLSASSEMNGNASGTQMLAANYNLEPISIGFNSKYVLDSLNTMEGDTVRFMLSNSSGAVIALDSADDKSLYILMPMQV